MKIEDGLRIRLKVKLQVEGGDVIEESVVEYFQGAGTMLRGLEEDIAGLEKGAKKKGLIDAKRAFGDEKHQPTRTIARGEFPAEAELESGARFEAKGPDGQPVILEVQKSDKNEVQVKYLHPLADKNIEYDIEVMGISDPKPPPLPAEAVAAEED